MRKVGVVVVSLLLMMIAPPAQSADRPPSTPRAGSYYAPVEGFAGAGCWRIDWRKRMRLKATHWHEGGRRKSAVYRWKGWRDGQRWKKIRGRGKLVFFGPNVWNARGTYILYDRKWINGLC